MVHLLLRTCIEDAVAECSKIDARIMVRLGSVAQVHSQQTDTVPNRRGDSCDKEKNRGGEEKEDTNPGKILAKLSHSISP